MQGQFSCVLTQATQIELKGVIGKCGTRCLSRIEESNGILRGAVHEVYTHDAVRCLLTACLGNRHDGSFHEKRASCLAVERIILERYGNGSTCATTAAGADIKLYLVAYIFAIGINKFQLHYTLGLGVNVQSSRDMGICTTSRECIFTSFLGSIARLYLASTSEVFPQTYLTEACHLALELFCFHHILGGAVTDDKSFLRIAHTCLTLIFYQSRNGCCQRVELTCQWCAYHIVDDDVGLAACGKTSEVFPILGVIPVDFVHGLTNELIGFPYSRTYLKADDKSTGRFLSVPCSMNG